MTSSDAGPIMGALHTEFAEETAGDTLYHGFSQAVVRIEILKTRGNHFTDEETHFKVALLSSCRTLLASYSQNLAQWHRVQPPTTQMAMAME